MRGEKMCLTADYYHQEYGSIMLEEVVACSYTDNKATVDHVVKHLHKYVRIEDFGKKMIEQSPFYRAEYIKDNYYQQFNRLPICFRISHRNHYLISSRQSEASRFIEYFIAKESRDQQTISFNSQATAAPTVWINKKFCLTRLLDSTDQNSATLVVIDLEAFIVLHKVEDKILSSQPFIIQDYKDDLLTVSYKKSDKNFEKYLRSVIDLKENELTIRKTTQVGYEVCCYLKGFFYF